MCCCCVSENLLPVSSFVHVLQITELQAHWKYLKINLLCPNKSNLIPDLIDVSYFYIFHEFPVLGQIVDVEVANGRITPVQHSLRFRSVCTAINDNLDESCSPKSVDKKNVIMYVPGLVL